VFLFSTGYFVEQLRTPSIAHLFSTSKPASAHNCNSVPHHNSSPLLPRVISLHAHSVAAVIHSLLYNISHTPRERFPMHFHAVVMERQPPQKEMANKANLTSKIRKCSHWRGDLILCYIPFFFVTLMNCHLNVYSHILYKPWQDCDYRPKNKSYEATHFC